MAQDKQIALSQPDQVEAFESVKEQIEADADDLDLEVREWGGEPTDGDTVRILSEAYRGNLSFSLDGESAEATNPSKSESSESERHESEQSTGTFQDIIRDILRFLGGIRWAR